MTDTEEQRPGDGAVAWTAPGAPLSPSPIRPFSDVLPLVALLLITATALAIYAWVDWPHHWQSRLMHSLLFMAWTIAWQCTVRGSLASTLGVRLPWWLALPIPPLAALSGELMQTWWRAVGHDPEWAGAGFSLLGVGLGWLVLGVWRWGWGAKVDTPP